MIGLSAKDDPQLDVLPLVGRRRTAGEARWVGRSTDNRCHVISSMKQNHQSTWYILITIAILAYLSGESEPLCQKLWP